MQDLSGVIGIAAIAGLGTLADYDCAGAVTTGAQVTPCSSTITTLENFFPHVRPDDGTTYQITDGQIVTLEGKRAWVANFPHAGDATTDYRALVSRRRLAS